MTRVATFKQSDVTRAVKGAANAGLQVAKVEIDAEGKIVVFVGAATVTAAPNPWDDEPEE